MADKLLQNMGIGVANEETQASERAGEAIKRISEAKTDRLKETGKEPKGRQEHAETLKEKPAKTTPKSKKHPQTSPEPIQADRTPPKEEKAEAKANTKPQKQSFSFRAEQSKIESWKLYAEATGADYMGALWTAAIDEYIDRHRLTADQQTVYDLKKQALEALKKVNAKL